jgi:hypothetical protein
MKPSSSLRFLKYPEPGVLSFYFSQIPGTGACLSLNFFPIPGTSGSLILIYFFERPQLAVL